MARQTVCASQLKQLGLALTQYADDSSGYYLCSQSGIDISDHWYAYLPEYLGQTSCASLNKNGIWHCPSGNIVYPLMAPYTLNYSINCRAVGVQTIKAKDSLLRWPSRTWLLCDGGNTDYSFHLYLVTGVPWAERVSYRHNNGRNLTFFDLHVEWQGGFMTEYTVSDPFWNIR
jgi:prepilin-type processing-associated H-X9-DG protein